MVFNKHYGYYFLPLSVNISQHWHTPLLLPPSHLTPVGVMTLGEIRTPDDTLVDIYTAAPRIRLPAHLQPSWRFRIHHAPTAYTYTGR